LSSPVVCNGSGRITWKNPQPAGRRAVRRLASAHGGVSLESGLLQLLAIETADPPSNRATCGKDISPKNEEAMSEDSVLPARPRASRPPKGGGTACWAHGLTGRAVVFDHQRLTHERPVLQMDVLKVEPVLDGSPRIRPGLTTAGGLGLPRPCPAVFFVQSRADLALA